MISLGVVVGQVAGGALVSADVAGTGWRPVFLVNLPIGVVALALARHIPDVRTGSARSIDVVGAGLVTAVVLCIVIPLTFGRDNGWPIWTWSMLVAAPVLALGALAHLRRRTARRGDPLIDLHLFAHRGFARGLFGVAALMAAYGGFLLTLTFHLQATLGYSAVRAGLTFAPYAIGFAVTSLASPKLAPSAAGPARVAGALAMGVGYLATGLLERGGGWHAALQVPLLAVTGAGFGACYSPTIARTIAHVSAARAQDASGVVTTIVQLGFALGVTALGSLYLSGGTSQALMWAFVAMAATVGLAVLTMTVGRRAARSPALASRR